MELYSRTRTTYYKEASDIKTEVPSRSSKTRAAAKTGILKRTVRATVHPMIVVVLPRTLNPSLSTMTCPMASRRR
jgi:hypothetical protein